METQETIKRGFLAIIISIHLGVFLTALLLAFQSDDQPKRLAVSGEYLKKAKKTEVASTYIGHVFQLLPNL